MPPRPRPAGTQPGLFASHPVAIGLLLRLLLTFALPPLMDDGLLLPGVRYTDVDYDVFTDAADHVASGRSPYTRHTYRYTPFLAKLLALPGEFGWDEGVMGVMFSRRYFGKILFCMADVICGYIIVVLRRRGRQSSRQTDGNATTEDKRGWMQLLDVSPELIDALWWLYNPLPINICTRGSAESLVVLLPVLATVAVADAHSIQGRKGKLQIIARACFAGTLHGIGIHAKLYPVIYTVSFMAHLSRQQQRIETAARKTQRNIPNDAGWNYLLPPPSFRGTQTFPWRHPMRILVLGAFWVQRLFFTLSSVLFLVFSTGTVAILTYLAVHYYGEEALEEGLLYHFRRVDHRHNYSMYWYWIYLARGRAEVPQLAGNAAGNATLAASVWGYVPLIPQVLILGFSSLGIAPYDLSFALFCQTFAFVAFNKVITAQYFTWYLCLLPLCSDRIRWNCKRMYISLGVLIASIVTWLLSAFTLEMLGWRSHRQVWMASLLFFVANVNLLRSILAGYGPQRDAEALSRPGEGWAAKKKAS
ncbi:hypothetical protein ACHAXT_011231 [Thalassiosira profunda]